MYNTSTPMGSSRPVFRDGQSSRRKEISRLSESKCKTIAFKAVVFFVYAMIFYQEYLSLVRKQISKSIWIFGGTICVGLGVLGIFLPVLPTTPFLLLAAFCYGRGSARFYHWLVERSLFSGYIQNYREGRGLPLRQKILSISLLWLTIGTTIWLAVTAWWLKALLLLVAAGVSIHLGMIKTKRRDSLSPVDQVNSI